MKHRINNFEYTLTIGEKVFLCCFPNDFFCVNSFQNASFRPLQSNRFPEELTKEVIIICYCISNWPRQWKNKCVYVQELYGILLSVKVRKIEVLLKSNFLSSYKSYQQVFLSVADHMSNRIFQFLGLYSVFRLFACFFFTDKGIWCFIQRETQFFVVKGEWEEFTTRLHIVRGNCFTMKQSMHVTFILSESCKIWYK